MAAQRSLEVTKENELLVRIKGERAPWQWCASRLTLTATRFRALYLKRKQKRPQEGPRMISTAVRVPSRQMRKRLIIQPANWEEERRKWIEVWTWKGKDLEVAERGPKGCKLDFFIKHPWGHFSNRIFSRSKKKFWGNKRPIWPSCSKHLNKYVWNWLPPPPKKKCNHL